MADEIKQPGNIASVLPTNPSRGAGKRKRPAAPPVKEKEQRRRQHPDDTPHQVDEYV